MAIYKFGYKKEYKQNPFIGFTSFNHFNEEALFTDAVVDADKNMIITEDYECYPVPQGVPQEGRKQGFHPDCTVAYFRILWKDFEPKQGEYDYAFVERILQGAKQKNQTVTFRLMPHSTNQRDDVPAWLKGLIDCPARPDGKREKDSPHDDKFLYLFAESVKAFANRFDKDPTLNVVDICLSGAWGEGHDIDCYSSEALDYLVNTYVECFPNTQLLGQIAAPWLIERLNALRPVGWRADGVLKPAFLEKEGYYTRFVPKIPQDIWKRAPVSFESFWWISEWKRQGWDVDFIIDWTLSLHVSTFNTKYFPIPYELQPQIERWIAKMGYHFVIDCCETEVDEAGLHIRLTVDNVGVAPIYNKIPLRFKLYGDGKAYEYTSDVDITAWLPGKNEVCLTLPIGENEKGEYQLGVGIFNEEYYVYFATDAEWKDGYYKIAAIG